MMKPQLIQAVLVLAGSLAWTPAFGQPPQEPFVPTQVSVIRDSEARQPSEVVPLDIQVVVSRYEGDKRVGSLPYSLAVNSGDEASQLRMGANVPVPQNVWRSNEPAPPQGVPVSFSYREIGTNIDCSAEALEDGRFRVHLSVEDTSVYTNVQDGTTPTVGTAPVFRTFRSSNALVLRDGQTRQFTAATDRVSGEVVRIEVTLRVVK